MNKTFVRIIALLLIFSSLLALISCSTDLPEETTAATTESEPDVTESIEEAVETFDIIKDGKSLYTIVRPEMGTQMNIRAAIMINNHIKNNGVQTTLSDWGDKTGEACEILVGYTKFFPEEALDGIDMNSIGVDGFVIKHSGCWHRNVSVVARVQEWRKESDGKYPKGAFLNIETFSTF